MVSCAFSLGPIPANRIRADPEAEGVQDQRVVAVQRGAELPAEEGRGA